MKRNEKKGRPLDFRTKYARLAQSKQFVLLPFYPSHTLDFDACSAVTEMHDRMIAADARRTHIERIRDKAAVLARKRLRVVRDNDRAEKLASANRDRWIARALGYLSELKAEGEKISKAAFG